MKLDILKAFYFFKEDQEWVKKLLISGLFMIIPIVFNMTFAKVIHNLDSAALVAIVLIIFGAISLVSWLTFCGYYSTIINKQITENSNVLPSWSDFKNIFITGIKYQVGSIICALPCAILLLLFGFLSIFMTLMKQPLSFLFITITILISACTIALLALMTANFGKDLEIKSFINYQNGAKLVKNNGKNYLILFGLSVAIFLIYTFVNFILKITKIGLALEPFIFSYLAFVCANLASQFVKSQKVEEQDTNS